MSQKPARARCMGPWPRCGHAEGTCTASPDYQAEIKALGLPRQPKPSPITDAEVEAGARGLSGHVGWRPFSEMALDRTELRQLVRSADGYDINEPTQSDCLSAARACLEAAMAVRGERT